MSHNELQVIRVPLTTPTLYPHTTANAFLIGNSEESILFDTGYDNEETKEKLESVIKENNLATPKAIIISHYHPDHAPGVRQLEHWSPVVYCHPKEEAQVREAISPVTNIALVNDGDILTIANEKMEVIHGPGHTAGHLSVYIPSQQILIAGDNIVAEGTTWIGPPDGDMSDYLATLNRLKQLKLTKIGPGHGEWVHNPYEQIEFVIKRRYHRENQIMSLLEEHGKQTAKSLTEKIYEDTIHPSLFIVAQKTTEAHLIKLINEGIVVQQDDHYLKKS